MLFAKPYYLYKEQQTRQANGHAQLVINLRCLFLGTGGNSFGCDCHSYNTYHAFCEATFDEKKVLEGTSSSYSFWAI